MTDKITTQCEHCSKKYRLNSEKFAGKRIKCPNCGQPIRVASNPEPEKNAETKPAPVQPQQRHPQSPVPQPQPTAPAPSSTARPSKSWKKKALAAVAALVLILVYTYWTELRAWYVEAESGEQRIFQVKHTDSFETRLSQKMIDKLELTTQNKEGIRAVLNSLTSATIPAMEQSFEMSKEQERHMTFLCTKSRRKCKSFFKKYKNLKEEEFYNKLAEDPYNYFYTLFLAYCWTRDAQYKNHWINTVLYELLEKEPNPIMFRERILRYLFHLFCVDQSNNKRNPGIEAILSFCYKTIIQRANQANTRAEAMACLPELRLIKDSSEVESLINKCLKLAADPSAPLGNLGQWAEGFEGITRYIFLEQKSGQKFSPELLKAVHKFTQFVAILLEPDGCLPQIDGVEKRICLRKPLYRAAQLFDRDDFRFIAYGGIRMTNARPPSVLSVYLPEHGKCIMRSSWNINYHKNKVVDKWLGDDQASMIIDLKTGEMSFYGYTHPQCVVKNTRFAAADPEGVVWKSDKTRDYLSFKTELGKTEIYFIKSMKTWIIRDDFNNTKILPEQEIQFYRSHTAAFDNKTIFSEHVERITPWNRFNTMINRQKGNVFIQSDQTPFGCSKINPEREGCYYNAKRKLSRNSELIITAVPFIRPHSLDQKLSMRFFQYRIPFTIFKRTDKNKYNAWTFRRKRYREWVYEKKNLENIPPEKEISINNTEVIIKDLNTKLTQK